jgi:hypothetical protein
MSELYQLGDRCLSGKLVPTLANRGCCVVSTEAMIKVTMREGKNKNAVKVWGGRCKIGDYGWVEKIRNIRLPSLAWDALNSRVSTSNSKRYCPRTRDSNPLLRITLGTRWHHQTLQFLVQSSPASSNSKRKWNKQKFCIGCMYSVEKRPSCAWTCD